MICLYSSCHPITTRVMTYRGYWSLQSSRLSVGHLWHDMYYQYSVVSMSPSARNDLVRGIWWYFKRWNINGIGLSVCFVHTLSDYILICCRAKSNEQTYMPMLYGLTNWWPGLMIISMLYCSSTGSFVAIVGEEYVDLCVPVESLLLESYHPRFWS